MSEGADALLKKMKNRELFEKVPIGTVVYGVHEHLYKELGNVHTFKEWVVSEEIVKKHFEVKYKEIHTSDGKTPYYYFAKDFGVKVFFTAYEAAKEAERRTVEDEQKSYNSDDVPFRRTYMKYLEEGNK